MLQNQHISSWPEPEARAFLIRGAMLPALAQPLLSLCSHAKEMIITLLLQPF